MSEQDRDLAARVQGLCQSLLPRACDVHIDGQRVSGSGLAADGTAVAVLGTCGRAAIGVDLALALAADVLQVIEQHPGRPMLILVDTQGQLLARRDELLGNAGYLAHLAKCLEVARRRGHRLLALVYGEAVSGGFLALGMIADLCFALEQAQIRVMALPAMARITGIAIERLESLCATSPIFGPGAVHYERLGAVQALWTEAQLADALVQALAIPVTAEDPRAALGAARGGRSSANEVIERVLNAP